MPVCASDVAFDRVRPGDAGWVILRHGALYAADAGVDRSFEPVVARILAACVESHDPAMERGWIACAGVRRLGSIFCRRGPAPGVARQRLFLVEPEARGLGLGQGLCAACLAFAREAGYARMRLAVRESHRAACALHAKSGFSCTRSEPVRSFGVDLVARGWTRDL